MARVYRAWINQPSKQQPHHDLNGLNGIAVDEGYYQICFYPITGDRHWIPVLREAVSQDRRWVDTINRKENNG